MPNTLKTVENPPELLPQPLLRESWPVVGAHPPGEAETEDREDLPPGDLVRVPSVQLSFINLKNVKNMKV